MPIQAPPDANRLNSKKSNGPASPESKTVHSLNGLESGIHSWSETIRLEDPAELEAITAAFLLDFHPTGANQLSLVDALASAEWTQRRLRRLEAHLWNYRLERLDEKLTRAQFQDESFQHTGPLGQAYQDALDAFNRIQRRVDSTNRLYLRTLKVLQDLQSAAVGQAGRPVVEPSPEPPSSVETQPLVSPIDFVPHFANAAEIPPHPRERNEPGPDPRERSEPGPQPPERSEPGLRPPAPNPASEAGPDARPQAAQCTHRERPRDLAGASRLRGVRARYRGVRRSARHPPRHARSRDVVLAFARLHSRGP